MLSRSRLAKAVFSWVVASSLAVPAWADSDYSMQITTPEAGSGPYAPGSTQTVAGWTDWTYPWPAEYIPYVYIKIIDNSGTITSTYMVMASVGYLSGSFSWPCSLAELAGNCTITAYAYDSSCTWMGPSSAVGVTIGSMPPPGP